jgi:hypothetical protein
MPVGQALDALSNWPALAALAAIALLVQPLRLLLMALVFRIIGVPKSKIADWALKHADSSKFLDVLDHFKPSPKAEVEKPPPKPEADEAPGDTPAGPRAVS